MAELLCVQGGERLQGEVVVSGAKNAALPLMIACLLASSPCVLENVPDIEDTVVTIRLLRALGAKASYRSNVAEIDASHLAGEEAPYSLVKAMRASFWVLGPVLARRGRALVSLPGGDAIGTRPVDLHLKGLVRFGAHVEMKHGVVVATAPAGLSPARIDLDFPSVGATHQLMMTASLIPGETVISGAAKEPEIEDVARLLCAMGAEIEGAGTETIVIRGREQLGGARHRVIGDRIEAATYLTAAAVTGGRVFLRGIEQGALGATLNYLESCGCGITASDDGFWLWGPPRLRAQSFRTGPFPGVATDVQAILMAAMTRAEGVTEIEETIFENRFGHAAEFRRFGAQIELHGRIARVTGVSALSGAPVEGGDIRAAVAMVIMGLMAEGTTSIGELHHLDRGYDNLVAKLRGLGAKVARMPGMDDREVVLGC